MINTLNELYLHTIKLERPCIMKVKRQGKWVDISVREFADSVRHFSTGLRVLGVKPEDRVALLSENRPEWTISDFAILAAGAVTVPIYPTLTPKQIEFLLKDSGAVAIIASNQEQVEKVLEVCDHCSALRHIIVFDGKASGRATTMQSVVEKGKAADKPEEFEKVARQRKTEDLATIVYTSGTTGDPKGAMLTHGNIASNVASSCAVHAFHATKTALSILPLSHIFERMVDFAYLYEGGCIAYAEDVTKVAQNLQEVKPNVFAAVPRIYEKFHARILEGINQGSPLKQKIARWGMKVAQERLPYRVEHKSPPLPLAIKSWIAERLVFRKILNRLGGNIRFVLSGGGPLSPELAAFFIGIGLEVYEGYGLTETSPVITVNTPKDRRLATVGKLIPGAEVKIAPDGEILARGPNVMKGYFNNPQATAEAIDREGWFHTGDIGLLDADGYLKITDRKKDIIVSAYGKNVAPQYVEAVLKRSPYIATPVVIGDRRKFITALIVPNFEKLEREMPGLGSREEMVKNPRVLDLFQKEIDKLNLELAPYEQVRHFTLLPRDFSIETNDLTPSMKVRRRVVEEKYKSVIDGMYAEERRAASGER